jgi:hypothetical protein
VADSNGNGVIDDGKELFGTNTGGYRYPSGFAALTVHAPGFTDGTGDSSVLLWSDLNLDGVSQPARRRLYALR